MPHSNKLVYESYNQKWPRPRGLIPYPSLDIQKQPKCRGALFLTLLLCIKWLRPHALIPYPSLVYQTQNKWARLRGLGSKASFPTPCKYTTNLEHSMAESPPPYQNLEYAIHLSPNIRTTIFRGPVLCRHYWNAARFN